MNEDAIAKSDNLFSIKERYFLLVVVLRMISSKIFLDMYGCWKTHVVPFFFLFPLYTGVSMWSRQPIRRPRPNSMKLSGFVENFSLIILVILFFEFDHVFIEIWAKYCFHILVFFEFFLQKNFATVSKNWRFVIIIRSNH